jgi:hypothetical protein
MRSHGFALLSVLVIGCGGTDGGDDGTTDEPAFVITSGVVTLAPGEEATHCYYFHTPNTATVAVNRWVSTMSPGSHHMIYFSNLGTQPPDGTFDDCEVDAIPLPVYGTQIPMEEVDFPDDDGDGVPLAQVVSPNTAGFFQMHYLNGSDTELEATVTLEAYALPDGSDYTQTDLFATYNNDIAIPPNAMNHIESATCDVVAGKFWSMSSHSHKQSMTTTIKDGAETVFSSTDWEHPGTTRFDPAMYEFQSGTLTWECSYDNVGDNRDRTVTAGQSARTDEMCMATGYYYPASGPRGCFMNGGQCQCFL